MSHAERFCLPGEVYLLSHSVGLLPRETKAWAEQELLKVWAEQPAEAWPSWMTEIEGFRAALAHLFNDRLQNFCPQANVSSGLTKVLHSLPERPDKPVLLLSEQAFPSLGFVCDRVRSLGYRVRFIDHALDAQDPQVWADHLSDDVGLVLITHVHSNSGQLVPMPAIVDLARDRDAWSVVDVAQSAGVIPIDLATVRPDFVVGSSVKWLCGGPGAGFLWVEPSMLGRCRPTDVGWFSHEQPFEFDIRSFRYASDALRFWGGTPAVAPMAVARRSLEVLADIGVAEIRRHNLALTDRLLAELPEQVVSPRERLARSGTVILRPGPLGERAATALAEAGISVDQRAAGLRISPHIYNNIDDVLALVEALADLHTSITSAGVGDSL